MKIPIYPFKLKHFSKLSLPALKSITFNLGPNVTQVTQTQFPTAFKGSELIVVGEKPKGTDLSKFQNLSISGDTRIGPVKLVPDVETETNNMERLWAYVKVEQFLAQRKLVEDKAAITKKALDLALKYSFVTEVTSLVVVKPKDKDVINPVDADLGSDFNEFGATKTEKKSGTIEETYIDEVTKKSKVVRTEAQNIDYLKAEIPWLKTILLNNGTIQRNPGWTNLDITSDAYQKTACNYTDNYMMTIESDRTKLHDCPSMFYHITRYSNLDKFLCRLNEKWGICCT